MSYRSHTLSKLKATFSLRVDNRTPLFREVAISKDDETFADCAQWQLSTLQWRNELETMIERLRRQREELNPPACAQKDGVDRSTKLDSEPETL